MTNDSISDLITRLRNANMAKHEFLEVPLSRVIKNIAKVLQEEGFISDYYITDNTVNHPRLVITLKYKKIKNKRHSILTNLKRISKPGRRIYSGYKILPKVYSSTGIAIISTSKGIMTEKKARKLKLGGEILCHVW